MDIKKHERLRELVLEYDGTQTRVFEEIVQILTPYLRKRYLYLARGENVHLMDDIINRTFLKLHETFPNAPPDLKVYGASVHAYNHLRNSRVAVQSKYRDKLRDRPERLPEPPTDGIEARIIEQEELDIRVDQVCDEVPRYCRKAVKLLGDGCSWAEVRDTLGINKDSWHRYATVIRKHIRKSSVLNNRPVETGADEHGGRGD